MMTTLPSIHLFNAVELPTDEAVLCQQCRALFACGIANGDDTCWCFSLPNVIVLDDRGAGSASACLCPQCLRSAIIRQAYSNLL